MKRVPGREGWATLWLLSSVGRATMRRFDEFLEPTEIRVRHVPALLALRDSALSQAELRTSLRIEATKLVLLLNELEEAGLTLRKRDPDDRRRHIVSLSELGRARIAALDVAKEKLETVAFRDLSIAQRALLGSLLDRVATNMGLAAGAGNGREI